MEREAARFYRKAPGMHDDPKTSRLFFDLVQWEPRHVRILTQSLAAARS
jgi:rubrerythrin